MEPRQLTIEFEPVTHVYTVNGQKAKISVTSLVEKQITKTEWFAIDPVILQRAADRGTDVHADCEYFIREGTAPRTPECKNYADYIKLHDWTIENALCEYKLAIEHTVSLPGKICSFILSGTADLICTLNGKRIIADYKTTSTVHEEYVRWQMSLLDYMGRKLNGCLINGQLFTYQPAEEMYVFHFDKQARFRPVQVLPISDIEIERLLDAEAADEEYHPTPLDILTPRQKEQFESIEHKLFRIKVMQDELKKEKDALVADMIAAFEAHPDTKKVEFNTVSVTYIAPSTKPKFDTDRFAQDHPDLYEQYMSESQVKSSVRITLSKEAKAALESGASEIPLLPPTKPTQRKNSKKGYFS